MSVGSVLKCTRASKNVTICGACRQNTSYIPVAISDEDDSDGYSTNTSWKKKTTKEETESIMGASADKSDSDALQWTQQ